jgi:hypothetical protein
VTRCQVPTKFGFAGRAPADRLDAVDDRFRREVGVADAEQVPAARADVADHHVPVAGQRLLHARVNCVMYGV